MNKIAKTLSATVMAGVMALSLSVSASAACTHYNQRRICGRTIDSYPAAPHVFYTMVNGVPVAKNCEQKIIIRQHTIICIVNGGCGYSTTNGGSECSLTHSACGQGASSLH